MLTRCSLPLALILGTGFLAATARAYVPQEPLVEPLTPIGIRISLPHDVGVSMVAFHVKINEAFDGLQAGTIARDVLRRSENGRWTYEDRTTSLRRGDVIHYWIHVVYNSLGYNLVNQQHIVRDFYDYNGERIASNWENHSDRPNGCLQSTTRLYDTNGRSRRPCAGQLLFDDDFRDLQQFRRRLWTAIEEFADKPDYEFVVYRNSPLNLNVNKGLTITPKLLSEESNGDDFVLSGQLTLNQCTGREGTTDCQRKAKDWYILPPVTSSRVCTKDSFLFEHGRVEIRAKLPRGDWIYPLLMLESASPWEPSLRIRIASANGNAELETATGKDISGRVLWGGVTGDDPDRLTDATPTKLNVDLWSERYHTYELVWSPERIVLRVDGQIYYDRLSTLPRDTPFYLTLGLAVGGLFEFPDNCKSGNYVKPWRNVEAKAFYRFYNSTELWHRTWQAETASLRVDYVKIWAL